MLAVLQGSRATIKNVSAEVAKKLQDGHGGYNDNMGKCLGKTGVVSYKYTDGDVKLKHEEAGNNEYCWSHALVLPATAAAPAAPAAAAPAQTPRSWAVVSC